MYDPMVAKLIVWDADREQATARMLRALRRVRDRGPEDADPVPPARSSQTEQWADGETCRDLIEDRQWLKQLAFPRPDAGRRSRGGRRRSSRLHGRGLRQALRRQGDRPAVGGAAAPSTAPDPAEAAAPRAPPRRRERAAGGGGGGGDTLASPLQGTVLKVAVEQGAEVEEGALICIIEAMKMENEITAHKAGTVAELPIAVGASVASGDTLAVISSASE